MAKINVRKQKHPRLPNGFGSIRYLGAGRRNPYAVHPPGHVKPNGVTQNPKAICYVDDWYKAFAILTAYKAGTYVKGMERDIPAPNQADTDAFIRRLLSDYNIAQNLAETAADDSGITFKEVYERFYKWKYEEDQSRIYSEAAKNSTRAAFKHCKQIHDTPFKDLRYQDLQDIIDQCPKKHATKELIVSLFHQIYAYGEIYELSEKDFSAHVKIKTADDTESGVPFTDKDLAVLWDNKQDPTVEFLLILCYSGFRISELKAANVDLKKKYFQGGMKTAAGKNRIVPIHSAILPLVKHRLKEYGTLLPVSVNRFRLDMYETLNRLGIEKHTPHDCRHTFSALCEKYRVAENDRKRMLGHSFGADITNGIYGHRSPEDLRNEIEKIKVDL